jgi:hypothetical protein
MVGDDRGRLLIFFGSMISSVIVVGDVELFICGR